MTSSNTKNKADLLMTYFITIPMGVMTKKILKSGDWCEWCDCKRSWVVDRSCWYQRQCYFSTSFLRRQESHILTLLQVIGR